MSPPKFDHLVVVMMENRSFDHMLGMLYTKDDPPPRGQTFDGLDGKYCANPISSALSGEVAVGPATSFYGVHGDPNHDFANVQVQLFGRNPIPTPPHASMLGFVEDYQPNNFSASKEVMSHFPTFGPTEPIGLRILPGLAREFAVSDAWFASVPTQTLPNRSFCNAGTSNGFVSNCQDWIKCNTNRTIFTALESRLLKKELGMAVWRIYHDHLDTENQFPPLTQPGLSLTICIHWPDLQKYDQNPEYCRSIDQFEKDAAAGDLPAYAFIEPRINGYFSQDRGWKRNPNDQHPMQDIRYGENFINRIYSAIRKNEQLRERTLLVITYDEHGGIYDHASPPVAVPAPVSPSPLPPPWDATCPSIPFDFTRLGVRVPAVIVSPYIPAGTVYHLPSPHYIDHTAIIKTLTTRWGLDPLTPRDADAADLSQLLTLDEPRTDFPCLDSWPDLLVDLRPPNEIPANDLQRDFAHLVARAQGLPPPLALRTEADVIAFFRSVPRKKVSS